MVVCKNQACPWQAENLCQKSVTKISENGFCAEMKYFSNTVQIINNNQMVNQIVYTGNLPKQEKRYEIKEAEIAVNTQPAVEYEQITIEEVIAGNRV